MAWLYVPGLEDSSEELNQSLIDTKPFVMSRGKPMRHRALSRKWKKDGWMKRLSGLTLEPLTAILGVEKWISFQEDSLANHSVKLENKKGQRIRGTYGLKYQGSLAKLDLQSLSWKTYQMSLTSQDRLSLQTWPKWGTIRAGVLYAHPTPMLLIEGRDSFRSRSIPTPTTMDSQYLSSKRTVMIESLQKGGWRGVSLKDYAQMFPTPTAKANQTAPSMLKKGGSFKNLHGLSKTGSLNPEWVEWLMGWPIGWTDCEPVETELSPNRPN